MTKLKQLISIFAVLILAVVGAARCTFAAPLAQGSRRIISVNGPRCASPGETITVTVTGSGEASGGDVELEGLEVIKVSGGFSSPKKYVVTAALGGLAATYSCRVTAPSGSACSFSLSSPIVSLPGSARDVPATCLGWTCAVRSAAESVEEPVPAESASAISAEPAAAPPGEDWFDALTDTVMALPSIYWDELCTEYRRVPYQIITGNAFLAQERTWEEYSLLMYDGGYVIVPFRADGSIIEPAEQHESIQATGQHMLAVDMVTGKVSALQDLVMRGDITGQGVLGVSQLVRLSRAVTGKAPLSGLAARAADLNGNERVDLGDLTSLAAWLRGRYVEPAPQQMRSQACSGTPAL